MTTVQAQPFTVSKSIAHKPLSIDNSSRAFPDHPRCCAWRDPLRFIRARMRMVRGSPLSTRWGLDRGIPAHRLYLQRFLHEMRHDIQGMCLEFQDRNYTMMFGATHVHFADVVHLNDSNPQANIIADITQPNSINDHTYDCIICTHVLHVIEDVEAAVRGLHRILKRGGVLLCAVPQISMAKESEGELWRFTRLGLQTLLERTFGESQVQTRAYGNSIVAAGEMRGLIADEFTGRELNMHDSGFAVEICARAVK